jgi:hypothetical protein
VEMARGPTDYLNQAKLPVIVFIHGGGFNEGSGAIEVYRGDNLAAKVPSVAQFLKIEKPGDGSEARKVDFYAPLTDRWFPATLPQVEHPAARRHLEGQRVSSAEQAPTAMACCPI